MNHKPGVFHVDCGGEIEDDWSKTYSYELENGRKTEFPAQRCKECGKEILGDPEVEIYDINGEEIK